MPIATTSQSGDPVPDNSERQPLLIPPSEAVNVRAAPLIEADLQHDRLN